MIYWSYNPTFVDGRYHLVIQEVGGKIISIVDNLDRGFVQNIVKKHNESIFIARQEGANLVIEICKNDN